MHLEKYAEVPCTCLVVDSQHSFAVASFYGTNKAAFTDKIQAGDLLYIKNPLNYDKFRHSIVLQNHYVTLTDSRLSFDCQRTMHCLNSHFSAFDSFK